MKKLLLASLCLLFSFGLQAQQDSTTTQEDKKAARAAKKQAALEKYRHQNPPLGKKGQFILQEAGDIGLGVNVIPLFHWFGNTFNGNQSNSYASFSRFARVFNNSVVTGRYMLTDRTALRASFGFFVDEQDDVAYVRADVIGGGVVQDSRRGMNGSFTVALGKEWRRGKGRLQGYYGLDGVLQIDHSSGYNYNYGNAFSENNTLATSYNWNTDQSSRTELRVAREDAYVDISIGVRPFIGLEYFIAPKIAIGGEFGWTVGYMFTSERNQRLEYFGSDQNQVLTANAITDSRGRFFAGLDNLSGAIMMNFYF